ncbi:hypothetical protein RND61_09105 [Streptomyces sp. TRM76323]|uniref:Small CPxCG-related zinc finger protein n=1 Tax=Streptomyces tamarix TaxID=3078565 RepID=A0ABU3QHK5_9ACTN|nr:hypothetical protein [Streptomyces tamarix]MDT9682230.1 hypothetical protein [Streptomyces tamarix]
MDESHEGAHRGAPDDATRTSPAAGTEAGTGSAGPFADCVLCGEPTEYPESTRGATLCPVCEWQEAQRTACSG